MPAQFLEKSGEGSSDEDSASEEVRPPAERCCILEFFDHF
jgi:hypothetical protein